MKIAVTGGSGSAGRIIIRDLASQGHELVNLDLSECPGLPCAFIQLSLTDYGATHAALEGVDAVVHFGSIPYPDEDHFAAAERFNNNTSSTFNVFNAAIAQGIQRVVWASSETVFGYPFASNSPSHAPLLEHMVAPQNAYAMSKLLCEQLAELLCQLHPLLTIIGLRLSNILYADALGLESSDNVPYNRENDTYHRLPDYWGNPASREFNLWNYIDARDVARAVTAALNVGITGAHACAIISNDTLMDRPSRELLAERFPEAVVDPELGTYGSIVSNRKAADLLGFEPAWSWRDIPELQAGLRECDA